MSPALVSAVLAVSLLHGRQESVNLARTFTVGEKPVYTATMSTKLFSGHSVSVDFQVTTSKLLAGNKTAVVVHASNKQATGPGEDTTKLPEDLTFTLASNNMPEKFPMRNDASIFELFLFVAGSTVNKPVKVGDDVPWTWSDGPIALSGSTKVLEISADKKKLKALITQKLKVNGQDAGTFTLTSNYDLKDGSLIDSAGGVSMMGITQELKFVRKS